MMNACTLAGGWNALNMLDANITNHSAARSREHTTVPFDLVSGSNSSTSSRYQHGFTTTPVNYVFATAPSTQNPRRVTVYPFLPAILGGIVVARILLSRYS